MRKSLGASILVLPLALNAYAGDIPSPPAPVASPPSSAPAEAGTLVQVALTLLGLF